MEPAKAHDCAIFCSVPMMLRSGHEELSYSPPEESEAVNIVLPQRPALAAHGLHLQVHIAISEPHMGATAWQS